MRLARDMGGGVGGGMEVVLWPTSTLASPQGGTPLQVDGGGLRVRQLRQCAGSWDGWALDRGSSCAFGSRRQVPSLASGPSDGLGEGRGMAQCQVDVVSRSLRPQGDGNRQIGGGTLGFC